jgi:uncharacterized protein
MTGPFIIDVHGHLGATPGFTPHYASPEDLVRLMDLTATEVLMFSSLTLLGRRFDEGYAETSEVLRKYPVRFRAYMVYDPWMPELSLDYLKRHHNEPGYVGVKIHPSWHGVPPDDARYAPLWAYASEHSVPVLTHTWSPDPAKPSQNLAVPDLFASVLEAHSNLRLILGHAGGRSSGQRQAVALLRRYPNCWADLSGDTLTLGLIEWLVQEAGADKLLFGTDANWIEPRYHLGRILKAQISKDDKLRILRTNALEVFGNRLFPKE